MLSIEQTMLRNDTQIQNVLANRNSNARVGLRRRKNGKWKRKKRKKKEEERGEEEEEEEEEVSERLKE